MDSRELVSIVGDLLEHLGTPIQIRDELRDMILLYCRDHWEELSKLSEREEIDKFLIEAMQTKVNKKMCDFLEEAGIKSISMFAVLAPFFELRITVPTKNVTPEMGEMFWKILHDLADELISRLEESGIDIKELLGIVDEETTFRELISNISVAPEDEDYPPN